jgi:hypothetical protein
LLGGGAVHSVVVNDEGEANEGGDASDVLICTPRSRELAE